MQIFSAYFNNLVLSGMFKLDDFYKENTMKVWERSEVVLLG